MERSELVTLMEFSTLGEAEIYKALLESAGIRSVVQNDLLAGMIPVVGPLLDIKLVVASEDEQKAREVLSAKFDKEQFREETGTGRKKPASGSAMAKQDAVKKSPSKGSAATTKKVKKEKVCGEG